MAIQHVAAGPGFVGEHQLRGLGLEPSHELVDVARARADLSDEDDFSASIFRGVGDGDRLLVNIQPDEQRGSFLHG